MYESIARRVNSTSGEPSGVSGVMLSRSCAPNAERRTRIAQLARYKALPLEQNTTQTVNTASQSAKEKICATVVQNPGSWKSGLGR